MNSLEFIDLGGDGPICQLPDMLDLVEDLFAWLQSSLRITAETNAR